MAMGFDWKNVAVPGATKKDPRTDISGGLGGYETALKTLTDSLQTGFDKVDEIRDDRAINAVEQNIAALKRGNTYDANADALRQQIVASGNPVGEGRFLDSAQREGLITKLASQKAIADANDLTSFQTIKDNFNTDQQLKEFGTAAAAEKALRFKLGQDGASRSEQDAYAANIADTWKKVTAPSVAGQAILADAEERNNRTIDAEVKANIASYQNELVDKGIITSKKAYDVYKANEAVEGSTDLFQVMKDLSPFIGDSSARDAVQGLLEYANSKNYSLSGNALKNIVAMHMEGDYTPFTGVDNDFDTNWLLGNDNLNAAKKTIDELALMASSPDTLAQIENTVAGISQRGAMEKATLAAENMRKVRDFRRGAAESPWEKGTSNPITNYEYQSGGGVAKANELFNAISKNPAVHNALYAGSENYKKYVNQQEEQRAKVAKQKEAAAERAATDAEPKFDPSTVDMSSETPPDWVPATADRAGYQKITPAYQAWRANQQLQKFTIPALKEDISSAEKRIKELAGKTDPRSQMFRNNAMIRLERFKKELASYQ